MRDQNWTYFWGVDPIWKGATNELLYYNSLKMKTSVIIGILQMTLGLFMHCFNSLHFKNHLDLWFEFVPRVLFLWCTFGYLVFLIFVKWNTNYFAHYDSNGQFHPDTTAFAPGILNEMINMFLNTQNTTGNTPMYAGQSVFQPLLKYTALLMVPMMFFPKPAILHLEHKAREKGLPNIWALFFSEKRPSVIRHDENEDHESAPILPEGGHQGGHAEHGEHEDITELWVHQGLETIEFVLGCISHTASYLRLWALSLAHSELSTVFFDKIVSDNWMLALPDHAHGGHFGFVNLMMMTIMSFIGVSSWLAVTFAIIMAMEVLSAFLHALRLHWVEFQSKFYKGDGYLFKPFVYRDIRFISEDNDDEL